MSKSSLIVSGPSEQGNMQPDTTLGDYLIDCLRKRDPGEIINIDGVTGEVQTCEELLKNTVKAVHAFKALGLEKGDVIALISENSITYNVPLLAAFCMGAIVSPLNPASTTGELTISLSVSKPKLVICSSTAINSVKNVKESLNFIQTLLTIGSRSESQNEIESFEVMLENTCVVDYNSFEPEKLDIVEDGAAILMSSGTTGFPKGVLLTHRNLIYTLSCISDPRCFAIAPGDSIIVVLPVFHMFGFMLYLASICVSIKSVILKKFNSNVYLETIEKFKVNRLYVVPTLIQFLNNSDVISNYNLSSVESIFVGAAPISNKTLMKVKERFLKVNLMEAYGITEAAGVCTMLRKFPKKPNCIGQLVCNMQAKVWDSVFKKTLGCMETGEICLKGPMIMKRYINFANNSSIIDEDGFYHTGDLGYYDEEGYFYLVDRIKDLIKYKGFQVSPSEIECLLLSHPDVKDCAVVGIPDEISGELAKAFVVLQNGSNTSETQILEFVAERVSNTNRLHGGVVFIDYIPKNPSGKILRKTLREHYLQASAKKDLRLS